MAKITDLPGIEVDIICNGVPLPEYPDLDDEVVTFDDDIQPDHMVTLYVESEADKEYIFQFTVKRPYELDCDYLGFFFSIDGEDLDVGQLCGEGHMGFQGEEHLWIYTVSGVERALVDRRGRPLPDQYIFTKFKFNKVSTTSDDGNISADTITNLGNIEVRVWRMTAGEIVDMPAFEKYNETPSVLPEKALKGRAISTHTIFEDVHRVVSQGDDWQEPTFMDENPIAVFRLKCRSRDDLLKEHIITPRTPSPKLEDEEQPALTSYKDLSEEVKLKFARIRYDINVIASNLMAEIGKKVVALPAFEELSKADLEELSLEQYMEITKPAHLPSPPSTSTVIKQEKRPRSEADDEASPSSKKAKRAVTGRVIVDLTGDEDDSPDPMPSIKTKSPTNNSSRSLSRSHTPST